MTLAEIEKHIKTFEKRIVDPELSEGQRAAFEQALEGAIKKRDELLEAQAPSAEPTPASGASNGRVPAPDNTTPSRTAPPAFEWTPRAEKPVVSVQQDNGQEKKTAVRSFARIADTVSTAGNDTEIVVDCDLESLSKTVMVFRWGKTEERLTPGLVMCRFKARVDDVARMEKKKPEESRCFHRAVAYYAGLSRFCGRELTQTDFGFRGRKANVLETIQEAYRNQKQQANA